MEDAESGYFAAIDAMMERCDLLAKIHEASCTGEGVIVRVVDDEITAERVVLLRTDTKEG